MATQDDIIKVAEGQLGYIEGRNNDNKFGKFFGVNHTAWCGWFVAWVFRFCGISLQLYCDNVGYTPNLFNDLRNRGWGVATNAGRKGSIVFFDFPDHVYRIQHVGIVKSVIKDSRGNVIGYITIEGNTSTKNQSNGGGVMQRTRYLKDIKGMITLPFLGEHAVEQPKPQAPPPTPAAEDQQRKLLELIFYVRQTTLGDGMENNGLAVATLQNLLNNAGVGIHLLVDGKWGPWTRDNLIWYQGAKGLAKDGICGPATWDRLLSGK